MPSSEMTLIENIETSVKRVSSRITAMDVSSAMMPSRAGIAEAVRLPKMSRASRTTSGSESSSARLRSSSVMTLTSAWAG
jgi:hypothetical protein